MTSIGCGLYGPITMKQKPTEKHWPPKSGRSITQHLVGHFIEYCIDESMFETWLEECKHYDAEYYDEE